MVEDHNGIVSEGFKASLMSELIMKPGSMFHVLPVSPAEQARRNVLRDQPGGAEPEPEDLATEYMSRYGEQNKQLMLIHSNG